jgi:hypothetical protein
VRRPQGGGWICVPLPSPVLNPAVREKEATMVVGLATKTLGVAFATTRRRRRPLMMEAIVLVIVATIVTTRDIQVMITVSVFSRPRVPNYAIGRDREEE